MAGQPQDPSWQPAGQDQTQARPSWPTQQQPTFTPPGGAPQDSYGYPQQPATGAYAPPPPPPPPPPPAYAGQERAYPAPDQSYQDQSYQDQAYQAPGYQAPGYQAQQPDPAGATGWQATPSLRAAKQPRLKGERGFIGSLFDFSFTSMVTPKIIRALYILITISTLLWAVYLVLVAAHFAHAIGAFLVLFIVDPVFVLVTLALWRVVLEYFMVTFRLHDDVKVLRRKAEGQL
jgi:hypothetical protein